MDRLLIGDQKFSKHIYHSILCIGALVAHQEDDGYGLLTRLAHPISASAPKLC
jgi:hypothetical protein